MYIYIYHIYTDTHKHTLLSIVTGVSKQQDVYACECTWDSSCELKRDNASMIKYSRGRNIHLHCLYLLRETRTRIAPCMIVLYVCIERNSYFPFFLFFFFFSSLLSVWQQQKMKRRSIIFCLLFGWLIFFSRHHSLCTSSLLTCFFFLILSTRFVDKRPRKGRGHPIEEKKQVISSCKWGVFFFLFFIRE